MRRKGLLLLIIAMLLLQAGCALSETVIRLGSTGKEVSDLQTTLKALGYYSGEITGHAGEKTVTAIKAFQSRYGLKADGIAGADTLEKVQKVSSGGSASSSTASWVSAATVKEVQTMLKAIGMYAGEITGTIGTKTDAAIRAFQRKYGLYVDGIPGTNTISKLTSVYLQSSTSTASGVNLSVETVRSAQTMLKVLGFYTGDITGNIGTKTEAAVRAFQSQYGLKVDGIPGAQTMAKLSELYSGGSAAVSTSLQLGSTGSAVSALQEKLSALGYYAGEITGHYGTLTRSAVIAFQKDKGLTADGIAGSKTLAALQAAENAGGMPDLGASVLDLHWFDEKAFYLSHGIQTGKTITITDIVTGKSFNGRIQSTGSHADVEPKTAEDTQTLCDIFGVTQASQISYNRRAVLVTATVGGTTYTYAASLYGEVHGSQTITDNDYDGQFCVHFRHSTTSDTQMEYVFNQEPIDRAVTYATQKLGMTHVTSSSSIR